MATAKRHAHPRFADAKIIRIPHRRKIFQHFLRNFFPGVYLDLPDVRAKIRPHVLFFVFLFIFYTAHPSTIHKDIRSKNIGVCEKFF